MSLTYLKPDDLAAAYSFPTNPGCSVRSSLSSECRGLTLQSQPEQRREETRQRRWNRNSSTTLQYAPDRRKPTTFSARVPATQQQAAASAAVAAARAEAAAAAQTLLCCRSTNIPKQNHEHDNCAKSNQNNQQAQGFNNHSDCGDGDNADKQRKEKMMEKKVRKRRRRRRRGKTRRGKTGRRIKNATLVQVEVCGKGKMRACDLQGSPGQTSSGTLVNISSSSTYNLL